MPIHRQGVNGLLAAYDMGLLNYADATDRCMNGLFAAYDMGLLNYADEQTRAWMILLAEM